MGKLDRKAWIILATIYTLLVVTLFGCSRINMTQTPVPQGTERMGESGVRGRVWGKSDVETLPDSPLQALVLAILSNRFDSLLEETQFTQENEGDFARLGLTLSRELFEKYVVTYAISQQNGEYELQVPPGSYLLCLADLDLAIRSEILPAYVVGCIEITVREGKWGVKDIFTHFGIVFSQ